MLTDNNIREWYLNKKGQEMSDNDLNSFVRLLYAFDLFNCSTVEEAHQTMLRYEACGARLKEACEEVPTVQDDDRIDMTIENEQFLKESSPFVEEFTTLMRTKFSKPAYAITFLVATTKSIIHCAAKNRQAETNILIHTANSFLREIKSTAEGT